MSSSSTSCGVPTTSMAPACLLGGGQIYDALVGAAAAEHALTLVTRDRRALPTYRVIDVELELLA